MEFLHAGWLLDRNFFMQVGFWIWISSWSYTFWTRISTWCGFLLEDILFLQVVILTGFIYACCILEENFFIQVTFCRRTSSCTLHRNFFSCRFLLIQMSSCWLPFGSEWTCSHRLLSGSEFLHAGCFLDKNVIMQVAFWIELLHAGCLLDHNFFMQVAFWIGFSSHKLLSGSEFLHAGCLLDQNLKLLDRTIYMLWFPFGRYCHLTGCLVDWNFFIQVTFWRRTSSYRLLSQSKFLHTGCLLEESIFMHTGS